MWQRWPNGFQARLKKKNMAGVTIIAEYFHLFTLVAFYMLITFQDKMRWLPFMVIFTYSLITDEPTELRIIMDMGKYLETYKLEWAAVPLTDCGDQAGDVGIHSRVWISHN